ncbi:MAG: superoxide dismutase [Candidatus Magasanikbacteria bacterium]|nr:superoxide dismutase [Candidatus Magasanikbacteria bacterium]
MFTLPDLLFPKDSMPQFCSAETFEFHHNKHHAGYVSKLNTAIERTAFVEKDLESIIRESYQEKNLGVFNNSAQHWNHSFFWENLSPNSTGKPDGKLLELIERDFGSVDDFKSKFTDFSTKLFGSGWVWLVQNSEGKLEILPMPNAGTPLTEKKTALITLDVWEHAYYIDYRNDRAKYIDAFWGVVNWERANSLVV